MANDSERVRNPGGWMGLVFAVGTLVGVFVSILVYLTGSRKRHSTDRQPLDSAIVQEEGEGTPTHLTGEGAAALVDSERGSEQKQDLPREMASAAGEGDTHWREGTKYMVSAFLVVALALVAYASRSVFPLVIIAFLIAFVVRPLIDFFQRRLRMSKVPATLVVYGLVVVGIMMTPFILLPNILQAINFVTTIDFQAASHNLALVLQEMSQQLTANPLLNYLFTPILLGLSRLLENFSVNPPTGEPPVIYSLTVTDVTNQLAQTLGLLVNVAGPIITALMAFIFMMMLSLYMSLSGSVISRAYSRLIPPLYLGEITGLIMRIEGIWKAFLKGQLLLMVIIGMVVWMGNLILGTRQALFLGIIAGLLELIPNLGPFLATIPAVAVALLFGSAWMPVGNVVFAIIIVAMYILIQQVENQIIVPKVLGGAVQLPPLIVLVGVLIFGSLFGILGVFLATPVIATGKEVFSYLYAKILEPPPSPKVEVEEPGFIERVRSSLSRLKFPRLAGISPVQDQKIAGSMTSARGERTGEESPMDPGTKEAVPLDEKV